MGRFNKTTGEFTPKPSSVKKSQRLEQEPVPLPVLRRGTKVKVFIGAGWGSGIVEYSDKIRCVVLLKIGSRRVTCYDRRNLLEEP